ncbi:MAG: aldehyde ferredoxin oxidoreductase family protein [Anaerolineaceae bacterium]|nr:aldehyde ferredoxin oxidoreductase family protein [Anaerolineaceae bacterium]
MHGYNGTILEVNLTDRKISKSALDPEIARRYLGGKGLGAWTLYERLKPGIDPLGEENIFIMATGPLTGSKTQTSGRWCILTKSPQTGAYLDSQVGGHFGAALKGAGFDLVVITGRADTPVTLVIEENDARLEEAGNLWGKGIQETTDILEGQYPGAKIGAIGPAGESQVLYSCFSVDRYHQAGRGGSGAVLGSKNLKAFVAIGKWEQNPSDPQGFDGAVDKLLKGMLKNSAVKNRRKYGTPMWVDVVNEFGLLPTNNFQLGRFDGIEGITAETMKERIVIKNQACFRCMIACNKLSQVGDDRQIEGPEYETIALLGSNCGIGPIEPVAYLNWLCDDYGLDTISAGNVIAFAMEASSRGVQGAPTISFGDVDAAAALLGKISLREGSGDLLAQGVRAAAKAWGQGSEKYAMHVKGMEFPGYDPRGAFGMSLAYATADRGACHQRAWSVNDEVSGNLTPPYSLEGRAKYVKTSQDRNSAVFSTMLCDFCPCPEDLHLELVNTMTGFDLSLEEYHTIGERIWNVTRLFNVREGFTRAEDTLPARIFDEALNEDERMQIDRETFERSLLEYYALREWDENGVPSPQLLGRLGLDANTK